MKTTWKKLQKEQDDIVDKLNKKLNKEEQKLLSRAINIEYKLAMVEEGHESELYE